MVYRIRKSVDISFAHHIRGHEGNCINVHGHTWKFELLIESDELTPEGFVVDFRDLRDRVLVPCHGLLDHSLAIGELTYGEIRDDLASMGKSLIESRREFHGTTETYTNKSFELTGAKNEFPGGLKVAVFPFNPTSERLAEWLYRHAVNELADERVRVYLARVYETMHPVESVAEYSD